jgi:hypothetical protein
MPPFELALYQRVDRPSLLRSSTLALSNRTRENHSTPTHHQTICYMEARHMKCDALELHAISNRLSKLEAQNRRLKQGAAAILIALSALVLMAQSAPPSRIVEAQKFVLKDTKGNVRAWLGVIGEGSELILGNSNQQPRMSLEVSVDAADLHFFGSRKGGMTLGVNSGEPAISLVGANGNGGAELSFAGNGPGLTLHDAKGLSTIVGATELNIPENAAAHQISAASVMLLDKDKKVVWRAP